MSDTKPEMEKNKPSDVEFAGIGWRIIAWIIDTVIIYLIYLLITLLFFWGIGLRFWWYSHILWYLIGLFYFCVLESNKGQTLGKLILGLRTVDEDTFEVSSFTENLKNCILKCHWLLCLIDFVIGVIKNSDDSKKRKRIMQNASHTVVIKIR